MWVSLLLVPLVAAQTGSVSGDVVIVPDTTGSGHQAVNLVAGVGASVCAFGARGVNSVRPDVFDAVVTFTTNPLPSSLTSDATPRGTVVRATATGATYGQPLIVLPPATYGTAGTVPQRLSHCVFMGPVQNLPPTPDDEYRTASPLGSMGMGLSGIEVLGHEFGHQWLVASAFDDGSGLDVIHRADAREPLQGTQTNRVSQATLHYSHYADSHSVMFGNFITPLGNGQWRMTGGARGYGPMDQYFMGLRAPDDTPDLLVLDDGSGMGLIGTPLRPGQTQDVEADPVLISVQDFIRAQGVRNPAFPNARRCFRVAFALAVQQGTTATPAQIAQVDTYRRRWEQWFTVATDGRANTVTSLDVFAECPEPALPSDAGVVDAGSEAPDAGLDVDAGMIPSGDDAGVTGPDLDAGTDGDAGTRPPDIGVLRPGCGCVTDPVGAAVVWAGVLLFTRRRRRPVRR